MGDSEESREARHLRVMAARSTGTLGEPNVPPPPYHVRDVQSLFATCRFRPDVVRDIVPEPLTPSKSGWGIIAMYTVPNGWGIAPYTGFFMALELEGFDSTDGSPGMYMHSGFYSGVGGQVMQSVFNRNFRIGWSRNQIEGGRITAEAGIGERPYVRMAADFSPEFKQMNGTSRYIGRRAGGGFNSYFVSFALSASDARVTQLEFLDGADEVLRRTEPEEYIWPIVMTSTSFTFSPPRPLGEASDHLDGDARNLGLVTLFSRMGRSAAIVGSQGELVSLNAGAERMVRDGAIVLHEGLLRPGNQNERPMFSELLEASRGAGTPGISDRLALKTRDGEPIIAQAIRLDPAVAGPDKLLVFFDRPDRDLVTDPTPALQLLGLTPAEARISGLVGGGLSPREVADDLELTLNTVRSALKIAYDKLGISRQSELARIVARLAG